MKRATLSVASLHDKLIIEARQREQCG